MASRETLYCDRRTRYHPQSEYYLRSISRSVSCDHRSQGFEWQWRQCHHHEECQSHLFVHLCRRICLFRRKTEYHRPDHLLYLIGCMEYPRSTDLYQVMTHLQEHYLMSPSESFGLSGSDQQLYNITLPSL